MSEDDLITPLVETAAKTHEMYLAFIDVGFTKEEALTIVISMMAEIIRKGE